MKQENSSIYVVEATPTEERWQVRRWQQHSALLPLGLILHTVSTEAGDVELHMPYGASRDRHTLLWAVGEVVAPTLALPPKTNLLPGELPLGPAVRSEQHRHYAEVELFPIAKPVPIAKLLEDERLEGSELANWQSASSHTALALSAQQVRAIEAFEWWIEEPSEDQRAELDQLLADEDPILDRLEASD